MPRLKYTAGSLMLWACFSAGGPEHLVQMHGIHGFYQIQTDKNLNLTASVRNLYNGAVFGSSTRTTIQNKHQNKHKNGSLSTKMNILPWLSLSSDLNHCRR